MNHNQRQMKSQRRSILYLGFWISILLIVSCGDTGTRIEHPDLEWLEGRWLAHDAGFRENWQKTNNSLLEGFGFTLEHGDTLFSENLRIFHSDTGTFYQALVREQNMGLPVYFKLVHHEPDSFVFSNPDHDFPRYIIYKKVSDDILHVFVRDGFGKESKGFSLEMKRNKP